MPALSDDVVALRPFRPEDYPALEALLCDPVAMEHTGGALSVEEAHALHEVYVRGGGDDILRVYAVEHAGQVVGSVDVLRFHDGSLEIGWAIARAYWRRGLGVRAARLVLGVARAMARPGQRVVAVIDVGHDASLGVARRIGMVPAGTHFDPDDGEMLLFASPARPESLEAEPA